MPRLLNDYNDAVKANLHNLLSKYKHSSTFLQARGVMCLAQGHSGRTADCWISKAAHDSGTVCGSPYRENPNIGYFKIKYTKHRLLEYINSK